MIRVADLVIVCKEDMNIDIELRLSAQKVLLGAVTQGLRAVSIESVGKVIMWRCIFGSEVARESQSDILSVAALEIIADFPDGYRIEEEYLVVRVRDSEESKSNSLKHLKNIVYLRHERDSYPEIAINT